MLAPYLLLGLLPVLLWVGLLSEIVDRGALAYDFHEFFYPQARDLIEGRTPTTAYPPLTTLFYVPFALLPVGAADVVITATMILCAGATLGVLGIRDWRCYGAAALWLPVYGGVQTANVSLVLALGVAALWRFRDRAPAAGVLVALMVAGKLFLWPLAGWLAATRRWRAAAIMVGIGLLASAAAWALIDFETVRRFPQLVRGNVVDVGTQPYTVVALLRQLGAPQAVAYATCWAAGVAVFFTAVRAARRGHDAASLALFLGVALLVSPVVWSHYLALLLVPVALTRPTFSRLWLAPLPLWVCPPVDAAVPQKILLLVVGAAILGYCARDRMRAGPSGPDAEPRRDAPPRAGGTQSVPAT
ncbi:MAG: glycosyltransferase family 87 protein [Thermoleophilia bacterium]